MQAVYYRDASGREPVDEYINGLSSQRQEELDYAIGMLNRLQPDDPPLPFPFSSQVQGQLRELRCHYGRELYRVLYRRSDNLFILLHIFEKRTKQIPEADKQTAQDRCDDFKARMDAVQRQPPRAAGHDAP